MKKLKLWLHSKEFDENEVVFNPKEFPDIRVGDIFEIFHPEDDKDTIPGQPRLLLQVMTLREDFTQKEVLSVDQTVANSFNLRNYKDVLINKVDARDVTLDLVEIIFKEQYLSRADQWHIKKMLTGSCAYLQKKINFFNARLQVREMWSKGVKVACGAVSDTTRLVFRSSTASISIFVQMSQEMWEFDCHGDLYFEKSVTGFLAELFARWKDDHCNHDVTIVLFSRIYYEASSIEDFPREVRSCILQSSTGRYYEDYYLVPIQNERYEDWTPALVVLKKLFHGWTEKIRGHHGRRLSGYQREDNCSRRGDANPALPHMPEAKLSNAAQGNYLEVLNICLNLYDKSYINRIFDHTGQVTMVLTAGSGVFEVERDLAHLTKQRTIDNGIGSDLVCMGEQPLHIVPLFKYIVGDGAVKKDVEFYVPHWINLSYFRMDHGFLSTFHPRIRVPDIVPIKSSPSDCPPPSRTGLTPDSVTHSNGGESHRFRNGRQTRGGEGEQKKSGDVDADVEFEDFDAYDAAVFNLPNKGKNESAGSGAFDRRRSISDDFSSINIEPIIGSFQSTTRRRDESCMKRISSSFMSNPFVGSVESDASFDGFISAVLGATTIKDRHQLTNRLTQALDPIKNLQDRIKQRPLNPFAPSLVHFKMSANRRRWVHAFPLAHLTAPSGCLHARSTHSSECEDVIKMTTNGGGGVSEPMDIHGLSASSSNPSSARTDCLSRSASSSSNLMDEDDEDCLRRRPSGEGAEATASRACSSQEEEYPKTPSSVESGESVLTAIRAPSATTLKGGHERQPLGQSHSLSGSSAASGGLGKMFSSRSKPQQVREALNFGKGFGTGYCIDEDAENVSRPAGVDWKALVIPALLPISTDYAPKKDDFDKDYFINEYSVSPADHSDSSSVTKLSSPSVEELFRTMVAQRLAKGFQIVSPHRPLGSLAPSLRSGGGGSTGKPSLSSSLSDVSEEHLLSIGRIFHRVSLCGPVIKVAIFRPRSPYSCSTTGYRYQFQVPDSSRFSVSTAFFSHVKLENFNWNSVDNYMTVAINPQTRGDGDYPISESMNFWRSRFLLLPTAYAATKKIVDGEVDHCDIYLDHKEDPSVLIDGFLRFMEVMNKLRRPMRKHKFVHSLSCGSPRRVSAPLLGWQQVSIGARRRLTHFPIQGRAPTVGELARSNENTHPPTTNLLGAISESGTASLSPSQSLEERKNSGPEASFLRSSSLREAPGSPNLDTTASICSADVLHLHSPATEIIAAFSSANDGVGFLPRKQPIAIPEKCFISAEAVDWVCGRIEGVNSVGAAVNLLQRLVEEGYIKHVGGSNKFFFGMFLYFVVGEQSITGSKDDSNKTGSATGFREELMEVALDLSAPLSKDPTGANTEPCGVPCFLWPKLPRADGRRKTSDQSINSAYSSASSSNSSSRKSSTVSGGGGGSGGIKAANVGGNPRGKTPFYKFINMNPDVSEKSEWPEWARLRYRASYDYAQPFDVELQWLVATGPVVSDLVYGWSRKIKNNPGVLHLLPMPDDPFCHPSLTLYTDPLRSPVFVPLDLSPLVAGYGRRRRGSSGNLGDLFSEFSEETRLLRLQMFQAEILKRFGFLEDPTRPIATPHFEGPLTAEAAAKLSVTSIYSHLSLHSTTGCEALTSWRFVHQTGGFFAGVPIYGQEVLRQDEVETSAGTTSESTVGDVRQKRDSHPYFGGRLSSTEDTDVRVTRIGFFWAWNFLLSRRWRSAQTGDRDVFPDKVLADFKAFCSNEDERLEAFWNSCLGKMMKLDDDGGGDGGGGDGGDDDEDEWESAPIVYPGDTLTLSDR